jgi:hypothetical protein
MSLPVNIDEYSRYVTMNDDELQEQHVSQIILTRLHRLRGLYAYWLQFPGKCDREIVTYDINMFRVSRTQAYDDLHLVQVLLGNLQQANKEFMRWKINMDIEEDLKAARRAQDYRAVAQLEKNRILNNRTDKDDEPELEFEKIVPQTFEPVDDPTVIGIQKIPDLRNKIKKLISKYNTDKSWDNTEYIEVEDDGTDDGTE